MLYDALIPRSGGRRAIRAGRVFVPDADRGAGVQGALDILARCSPDRRGDTVMGTVKGDVTSAEPRRHHARGAASVYDLGVNVAPRPRREGANQRTSSGFSAFLTTTMPRFRRTSTRSKAGIRDQVIVMVGGAPSAAVRGHRRRRRPSTTDLDGCGSPETIERRRAVVPA
jgi:5-methyltetrahydrofolate--homocysteine methyltransferase